MADMMNAREAAFLWGMSDRRVAVLCKSGRIEGAIKQGRNWLIPANTPKPEDRRVKTGAYQKAAPRRKVRCHSLLPLPIGISDYRTASSHYYYVDKTLLIRDFIDEIPKVSLFTRPRRFGKTLNMDMLRTFFEKTDEDTSVFFKDRAIWSCGMRYRSYQGKYPVIFLTFKDIKFDTWNETVSKLSELLSREYARHMEVAESAQCVEPDRLYFKKVVAMEANPTELTSALLTLSKMLHEHHGTAPIIIIDEYDTPIQQGHTCGFYEDVIRFMRNLFSGGLKDNPHLSYGFLTGILRVAQESIFSGLNNLKINSILDSRYSTYFGFTAEEVRQMAAYYNVPEKYTEICEWYDGYRFGKADIFNPWSVINYFGNDCEPRAFWQSTGSNEIIGEVLEQADESIYEHLNELMQGQSFTTYIDTNVIYPAIRSNPSSIYSFLLMAGYLKALKADTSFSGDYMCEVALPNREIALVYKKEIMEKLGGIVPQSTAIAIQEALYANDVGQFRQGLERLLRQSASAFDTVGEIFYHGLVLGLCASLDNRYYVTSNRESGDGRYDIQLMPKSPGIPGIIMEFKWEKDTTDLKPLAVAAIQQIKDRGYDEEMRARGITDIVLYGIGFSGKHVEIISE